VILGLKESGPPRIGREIGERITAQEDYVNSPVGVFGERIEGCLWSDTFGRIPFPAPWNRSLFDKGDDFIRSLLLRIAGRLCVGTTPCHGACLELELGVSLDTLYISAIDTCQVPC
jgi:hypothetical protein